MIVCLGWGSLIWDSRELAVECDWRVDGPQLPIEFTRISSGGRLTLVVTEAAPPVFVLWSHLSVASVDDAILALANREGIPQKNMHRSIGVWSPERSSRHAEATTVAAWARERNLDAVLWTALKPGFPGSRGKPIARHEALNHLRSLEGQGRSLAEEYVRRAPAQVRTPYRAAIENEFGWTAI